MRAEIMTSPGEGLTADTDTLLGWFQTLTGHLREGCNGRAQRLPCQVVGSDPTHLASSFDAKFQDISNQQFAPGYLADLES